MQSVADIAVVVGVDGGGADWVLEGGDLKLDYGIRSTVLTALFSDARAPDEETGATAISDPRGVWFDTPADRYGSLLWLLDREVIRDSTETKVRQWIELALQFLLDREIAKSVEVVVKRNGPIRLDIGIIITRSQDVGWRTMWDAEAAAVVETPSATIRVISRG
jgi:phage gp46-like protein